MLATVQRCIDAKTDKVSDARTRPDRKWLFVDARRATWQQHNLTTTSDPASEELAPDAPERNPPTMCSTRSRSTTSMRCGSPAEHSIPSDHIVLRLFKTGDAPQHKIVRRC